MKHLLPLLALVVPAFAEDAKPQLKTRSLFNGKDLTGWHGEGYVVEDGAIIYQQVTLGAKDASERTYPVIRAGAKVYAGAIVIGAVEVGEGATVAANSVVVRDVAPGTTVAGSPARPI